MDTRTASHQNSGLKPRARLQGPGIRWQLALVAAVVLLLRLPFLNQAVQATMFYFLAGAEHAQIEPLHSQPHELHVSRRSRGHARPSGIAWSHFWLCWRIRAIHMETAAIGVHSVTLIADGLRYRLMRPYRRSQL